MNMFEIHMGVPEMDQFWEDLSEKISVVRKEVFYVPGENRNS